MRQAFCAADESGKLAICSVVCLVRFMVEAPAQSGPLRALIHPGPVAWVHVRLPGTFITDSGITGGSAGLSLVEARKLFSVPTKP